MDGKYELRVKSVVRDYHFYRIDCSSKVWDKLQEEIEKIYSHNRYAVTITVDRK